MDEALPPNVREIAEPMPGAGTADRERSPGGLKPAVGWRRPPLGSRSAFALPVRLGGDIRFCSKQQASE